MSNNPVIKLDGPDAYLLEEEEKIKHSVALNNQLRCVIQSRNKPDTSKMAETSEFINVTSLKRKRSSDSGHFRRKKINSNGENVEYQKFRFLGINKENEKSKDKIMKLPWEEIPKYLRKYSGTDIFFIHLNNEIVQLVKWLELTSSEHMLRTRALARITLISHSLWPGSKVQPFGSYYTGLSLPTGDLDVCILNVSGDPKRRLREFATVLKELRLCAGIELILTAKVPIVKYVDSEACISVDISLNQESSMDTTQHISECLKKFSTLRPLLIILKLFLKQRGLDETYLGGLGSYSQFCLVLSFLQQHSSSYSPALHKSTTLGHLLFDFLELFGIVFNYTSTGIRLNGRGEYFRRQMDRHESTLHLESPLPPHNDMGKGAFRFDDVRESFRLAFFDLVEFRGRFNKMCSSFDDSKLNSPECYSILSSILCIDDELFQCRSRTIDKSQPPISAFRKPPLVPDEIIKKVKLEIERLYVNNTIS
ncbi:TRF4/5 nucletotidyl transferase [Cryptosporidium canis]|uniref:TRF4/5 nucletotidyl transferase n=1 Tax=Cryptosporidium canis TaxID=195482 RepID=A0A9D5DFJ9_9CRYT|nr:TRF4/5 nucletotidyl transferase [Cryptosporidium canis]